MKPIIKSILAIFTILSATLLFADDTEHSSLNAVISGKHRAMSSERDQYRHPLQTLQFFQVKDNQSIIEIWPGGGAWYTEILAPLLREKGTFYAAQYNLQTENDYQQRTLTKFNSKISADPALYDKINMVIFNPPSEIKLGAPNSVDRVLTFRNLHNWTRHKEEGVLAIFQAFYQVLKPGGKLGLIDHRLPEDRDAAKAIHSGYVKQSYAIKMAEAAGFKLEASSEINANANDTADHPKGVWTLPPVFRLKEQDKEKYLSIGESDRMTLLFVKP